MIKIVEVALPYLLSIFSTAIVTYVGSKYANKIKGSKITKFVEDTVEGYMSRAAILKSKNADGKLTEDQKAMLRNDVIKKVQQAGIKLATDKIVKEINHAVKQSKERHKRING